MQLEPKQILNKYWGHSTFKGSQERIISFVLEKRDVLALMPTGGGKSICYQVPALTLEGICIVVSPLVALIQDQVNNLKKKGIKAIALTGGVSFDELNNLLDNCVFGNYKFLYLSPERLQQNLVQERIQQMNVNLIAIDEAHCISQWGNDFRPAYLDCSLLRELLPNAPIIALTATATKVVADEILANLRLDNAFVAKDSFLRKNIAFSVKKTEDKQYHLKHLLAGYYQSAIVYVRTRRKTVEVATFLNKYGTKASYFHGGLTSAEKKETLNAWLTDKISVIVATNAFGMGVDKPDVRLVVHYQIPDSIENYFQEAGRAGRDGQISKAILLTNKTDEEQAKNQFVQSLPDTTIVKNCFKKLTTYFQIAYGEGSGQTFSLNFNSFCARYELNNLLTFNAFRILDRNGVISLSEAFHQKITVQFIARKGEIFNYLEKNESLSDIILLILRTYGGIFEYETKINTYLLARKSGISEKRIHSILLQLQSDGLIEYSYGNDDLEITFLVPREDDKSINTFAKKINDLNKIKRNHLESMLAYINQSHQCRSSFLLRYFGENQNQDCGICDICKEQKTGDLTLEQIKSMIFGQLQQGPKTSRILTSVITNNEKEILTAIQEMVEDGLIILNHRNQYDIR